MGVKHLYTFLSVWYESNAKQQIEIMYEVLRYLHETEGLGDSWKFRPMPPKPFIHLEIEKCNWDGNHICLFSDEHGDILECTLSDLEGYMRETYGR